MNETTQPSELSRREAIRKGALITSAAIFGGAASAGNVAARRGKGGNLVSAVASQGHYSHFPGGPATWKRMKNPFDTTSGDSRWKAKPAAGGSIRCLVEDIPSPRNAGFDIHLGPVDDIDSIEIDAETVETQLDGGSALYGIALYLDASDNGTFFEWSDGRGNTEEWVGFGGDGEAITAAPANGTFTVDGGTSFPAVFHLSPDPGVTLGKIQDVYGDTNAAVYIGVLGSGSGREEIVVNRVDVMRD